MNKGHSSALCGKQKELLKSGRPQETVPPDRIEILEEVLERVKFGSHLNAELRRQICKVMLPFIFAASLMNKPPVFGACFSGFR